MHISFDNVTRINGNGPNAHVVLNSATMRFPADRSVGVLGIRGAGKSTIARLLTGAVQPQHGVVTGDCSVSFPIAYTGGLSPHLSGRQNVIFLARIYAVDPEETSRFVYDFSGLGDSYFYPFSTYSGEKRSRFILSVSYAFPFDVHIADATLIGGPPEFREKCKVHVQLLRKSRGFIVMTQSVGIVREFCDSACVLTNQKLIWFEKVRDAIRAFRSLAVGQTEGAHEDEAEAL
jgi:capsular polysaccharide transport system ATP-binding protein